MFFFGVINKPRSLDCSAPPARRGSLRFPDVGLRLDGRMTCGEFGFSPHPLKPPLARKCSVVKIKKSQTVLAKFTSAEFVRFALSPFSQTRISKIFPVVFGIDSCDMF